MGLVDAVMINVSTILPRIDDQGMTQALRSLEPVNPYIDHINVIPLDRSYEPVFFDAGGTSRKYEKQAGTLAGGGQPLCEEPFGKLNVLWDGTVSPCCHDINAVQSLGDVNNQSIDEIWLGENVKALHQALLAGDTQAHGFCAECLFPGH